MVAKPGRWRRQGYVKVRVYRLLWTQHRRPSLRYREGSMGSDATKAPTRLQVDDRQGWCDSTRTMQRTPHTGMGRVVDAQRTRKEEEWVTQHVRGAHLHFSKHC
jgi:hypothetical protein